MAIPEDEFFDQRVDYYNSDECFERAPKNCPYMPSPTIIEERKALLKELRGYGFNERFICSIMQHDTPTIEVVRASVEKYGPSKTWRRYRNFLASTEYDIE